MQTHRRGKLKREKEAGSKGATTFLPPILSVLSCQPDLTPYPGVLGGSSEPCSPPIASEVQQNLEPQCPLPSLPTLARKYVFCKLPYSTSWRGAGVNEPSPARRLIPKEESALLPHPKFCVSWCEGSHHTCTERLLSDPRPQHLPEKRDLRKQWLVWLGTNSRHPRRVVGSRGSNPGSATKGHTAWGHHTACLSRWCPVSTQVEHIKPFLHIGCVCGGSRGSCSAERGPQQMPKEEKYAMVSFLEGGRLGAMGSWGAMERVSGKGGRSQGGRKMPQKL